MIVFNGGKILFDGGAIAFDLDCCCDDDSDFECPLCQPGSTPTQLGVSFTAIDNAEGVGLPCDCDAIFNPLVSFILDQQLGVPCLWTLQGAPGFADCAIEFIAAEIQLTDGNYFLRLVIVDSNPIDAIEYIAHLGNNPPNCDAFNNQPLRWNIFGGFRTSLCTQSPLVERPEAFVSSFPLIV